MGDLGKRFRAETATKGTPGLALWISFTTSHFFSPLLIATGEAIPLRGLEGVPGLPGSGVFSNTTVQKHQFFSAQLPSQSNSHIHT